MIVSGDVPHCMHLICWRSHDRHKMWLALLTSNCQIGGGSGKLLSIDVGTCGYACEAAYSIRVTGKVLGLKWGVPTSGSFHQACHM